jgi:4-amino-4-deoxychorismate lyase
MATRRELVVTLDGRVLAPDAPFVCVDDPVFSRGDGVFETLLLRDGRPALLEAHLARLGDSAALTGLPEPDLTAWRRAVATAAARWDDRAEAVVRLVYGRGRLGVPVAFIAVSPVPERVAVARRDGVSAVTLDRGGSADVAPWSLAGAKSSSYAANAAALRHAERLGVGDVVFCSSDGVVLEGPRSTVVIASGGVLLTPPTSLPILPGTTARALFGVARERGVRCEVTMLGVTDLLDAQGVWLLSSVTLAARVHTLDGLPLRAAPMAAKVAAFVDAAIAGEP